MNLIQQLTKDKLITPPYFLPDNVCLLSIGGSYAYGVNNDKSDMDIWGICFPPRHYIFPHEVGFINGFGTSPPNFEVYQEHHVYKDNIEYDLNVYSIVKFFELTRVGNPNLIDFLFVPENCVIHITKAGQHIRDNRKLFLSKSIYHRYRGFAYNHIKNMKNVKTVGRRAGLVEKYGFDVKDAGHVVRCILGMNDILNECDYDIQRHKETIKAIRRGEWTYEKVCDFFSTMETVIENSKNNSKLPEVADEQALKKVLLECLEIHYGRLDNVINDDSRAKQMLREISNILQKGNGAY